MAKYKHTEDTKIVLDDLENRLMQLMEVNETHRHQALELVKQQNQAFSCVLVLIRQLRDNGHIMRGNDYFPDPIEERANTKFNKQSQLGVLNA